jgi:molecular chaperone GrpE
MEEERATEPQVEPPRTGDDGPDLLALLQRERADFTNYRRRMTQERAEERDRERARVLAELLPPLDDLDRALDHVPADLAGHPWAEGVALTRRRLTEALEPQAPERFGEEGEPFDPAVHEAVHYEARPDARESRVDATVRAGYRLGGRLVRPAQITIVGPPRARDGAEFGENPSGREGTARAGE